MPVRYLTPSDLALVFGVSEQTITRWARTGQLPSVRLGNRHYFAPDRIAEMWDSIAPATDADDADDTDDADDAA